MQLQSKLQNAHVLHGNSSSKMALLRIQWYLYYSEPLYIVSNLPDLPTNEDISKNLSLSTCVNQRHYKLNQPTSI